MPKKLTDLEKIFKAMELLDCDPMIECSDYGEYVIHTGLVDKKKGKKSRYGYSEASPDEMKGK